MPGVAFSFILGADAFGEIETWKEYESIFSLCDIIVASRPMHDHTVLAAALPVAVRSQFCYLENLLEHRTGNRIIFQRITDLDISASSIRRLLARGLSIRYLVPLSVERYITRHALYIRRLR